MSKPGTKLQSPSASTTVIVVRDGGGDVRVDDAEATLQVGKRFGCTECAAEVLVVRPGPGVASCHGAPMVLKEPKKTAAAD